MTEEHSLHDEAVEEKPDQEVDNLNIDNSEDLESVEEVLDEEDSEEIPEAFVSQEDYDLLMTQYTRLRADFENYKRRTQRDQSEVLTYANASLVEELLPVLDTLGMALSAVPADADDALLAFANGIEKIDKQLFDILAKAGLKKIDADCAPFDPEYHEAVMMVQSEDVPAQHIAEVLRPGYVFKEKVLRPTVCKVAQE